MGQSGREAKARYRERNREQLRAKGRAYAARKRREAGMPALGTPESTENRRKARKLRGPKHPNWKGDEVGYIALHRWVERHKPRTGICSQCGSADASRTEWANVSGEYRRDLDDYIELCAPCHRREHAHGLIHGTATGYGYYGCRCEPCRQANTERKRAYLRRKAEARH